MSAQRRDQALQDVPISLQVVDQDLINDTAATDMGDLNGLIPGLVVSDGHTDLSAQWGYRGETRCNGAATLQGTCQVSPNFKVGDSQERLDLRAAWTSDSEHWGVEGTYQF